jgi:hypothetical protein
MSTSLPTQLTWCSRSAILTDPLKPGRKSTAERSWYTFELLQGHRFQKKPDALASNLEHVAVDHDRLACDRRGLCGHRKWPRDGRAAGIAWVNIKSLTGRMSKGRHPNARGVPERGDRRLKAVHEGKLKPVPCKAELPAWRGV